MSASTVSRAFSRPELVKESVRQQILQTAEDVGYIPNRAARGLATGRAGLFGLVVSDITNPFFPPLVRSIQRAAEAVDTGILFLDTEGSRDAEIDLIQKIKPQVDGIIIASPRLETPSLQALSSSTPTVVINREVAGVSHVVCDNTVALKQAAEMIYAKGHREIALVGGPEGAWAAQERARAVREWAQQQSDVRLHELGNIHAEFLDGQQAADHVISSGATGIFAFDDLVAAGVIAGLNGLGQRVPQDRSVIGCDDILLARTMTPALTTVSAPMGELGTQAVLLLKESLRGGEPRGVRLQGELATRGTVAPPSLP